MKDKEEPLKIIVKSSEYIQGYKDGKGHYASAMNRYAEKLREISDEIDMSFVAVRVKPLVKTFGIMSGKILLTEKFDTKDAAWNKVYEMCGDKIAIERSNLKVIKL